MRTLWLVALLVLAPMAAIAVGTNTSPQVLVAQQIALRDELPRSPQGLTSRQVSIMRKAQDEFFRLVDGKTTLDQLGIDDKVRV